MQYFYRIADLVIEVDALDRVPEVHNFQPFRCGAAEADLRYRVELYPSDTRPVPPEEAMELVSQDMVNRLYLGDGRLFKRVGMLEGDPRAMWFEQRIGDWRHATVYIPDDWLDYKGIGNVFSFEKTLLPFSGLMLHCSLIECEGRMIAFSAPSGTGKSTQARLWEEHKGARVINGDRGILRNVGGVIYAYGSPYAGSSQLFIDEKAPLAAIVMLGQADENTIRKIPQDEALGLFVSQSSLPLWQPDLFEMGMATLEAVITGVPMYRLDCLPDEGAVECVYECLK
ncbi:MAG: hypothetical protein FWG37_06990 [Clostridia bacterium]|nr:hypothetical protein [Clostridia bacterium]